MARHRTHSIEFKRRVVEEYLGGEPLHGLGKRHDLSRNLIRIWIEKFEAGEYDDEAHAADLLQEHEAIVFYLFLGMFMDVLSMQVLTIPVALPIVTAVGVKTNTPEFAVEGYTANALFGVTRNPWNPELTPGDRAADRSRWWRRDSPPPPSGPTAAARSAVRRPIPDCSA